MVLILSKDFEKAKEQLAKVVKYVKERPPGFKLFEVQEELERIDKLLTPATDER